MLSNTAFEEVNTDGPVFWSLTGEAEWAEDQAYLGRRSLRINAGTQGGARSEVIPLKPDTLYQLRFHLNIEDVQADREEDVREIEQQIRVRIQFMDADRRPIPGRVRARYRTADRSMVDYVGPWLDVRGVAEASPPEARFGRVEIWTTDLRGIAANVDNVTLEESPRGQPVRIEVGELRAMASEE